MEIINYKQIHNIQIGIDVTDHIVFICPKCKNALEVTDIRTINNIYDGKTEENCTYIHVCCNNCKIKGKRKFYWISEDGEFCTQRTYK